jgi:endonuclease YncB( thermonuclease family)
MSIKRIFKSAGFIVAVNIALVIFSAANAETYSPFPGVLPAKLIAIKSAANFTVSAETWPGFRRTFNISLAAIDVPRSTSDVEPCQRQLAEQALELVKEYLADPAKLEIHDMTMQTSADKNAQADIYTDRGSLSKALIRQGLARPIATERQEPWC